MKPRHRIALAVLCALMVLPVYATHRSIDVVVSPSVLVTRSRAGTWVTVHANVPIKEVNPDSAWLAIQAADGTMTALEPVRIFPDATGDLVAKFDRDEIRDFLRVPQQAVFVFEVYRLDGSLFSGSFVVTVK